MDFVTKGYEPYNVLGYFEKLCAIPRGSGNEAGVADMLCDFARLHSLEYYKDEYNNVLIKKKGSAGKENDPPVMLQGHTDMVCEKNGETVHDFLTDPLSLYIKDGKLCATGTTLGGDDGIAVAYMLAILEDEGLAHPPLECLFTSEEETGMNGAMNFDYSRVSARKIINIDSEEEGKVTMSCAGAVDMGIVREIERLPANGRTLKISITGLAGGHSGTEINENRSNAIRIMGRILARLYSDTPFNLCIIEGGNKRNAIPRECEAQIYVLDSAKARETVEDEVKKIRGELTYADKGMKVRLSKGQTDAPMLSYKDSSAVINMMTLYQNGVISMSPDREGLVRCSSNMGRISTKENSVTLEIMSRSSSDSEMDALLVTFARLSKALEALMTIYDRHPGWDYNPNSALANKYVEVFDRLYGGERGRAEKCAIHAGLECGIIIGALGGNADAISIGPDIYNIHTPDEALDLASVKRTYNLLLTMLSEL